MGRQGDTQDRGVAIQALREKARQRYRSFPKVAPESVRRAWDRRAGSWFRGGTAPRAGCGEAARPRTLGIWGAWEDYCRKGQLCDPKAQRWGRKQAVFGGQGGLHVAGDEAHLLIDLKGPYVLTLRLYPFHNGGGGTFRRQVPLDQTSETPSSEGEDSRSIFRTFSHGSDTVSAGSSRGRGQLGAIRLWVQARGVGAPLGSHHLTLSLARG